MRFFFFSKVESLPVCSSQLWGSQYAPQEALDTYGVTCVRGDLLGQAWGPPSPGSLKAVLKDGGISPGMSRNSLSHS